MKPRRPRDDQGAAIPERTRHGDWRQKGQGVAADAGM